MNRFAQQLYLDLLAAHGYEWQEPEHINAKWYHLLLLLIPIVGFVLFIETVKAK